jgi:SSS family transporter
MNGQVSLQFLDVVIFAAYMVGIVAFAFWVSRKGKNTAQGYFLGNKTIPWFVIGSSMVAADISSEQFISNVGGAYKHGIVLAAGDWNAWIIYSLLILIFLPYYVRTGVTTMPEFLERRYNSTCRYIFAIASVIGFVAAINAGALYSGGIMLDSFFGEGLARLMPQINLTGQPVSPVVLYIVFFAVTTGVYTIYGGLKAAAWTDLLQMIILLFAGFLVPVLALRHVTGIGEFIAANPEHFQVFKPPTHKPFPLTGVFTGFLSVGIWYSCTSQHIVQRVLAARDEWHARVGVICAGFLHIIMPFFFIVPGIIAFKMFPQLDNSDQAYLVLVKQFIPTGLKGLLLAGMAAALMGHVSTVLNSASTILTIDIYKRIMERNNNQCDPASIIPPESPSKKSKRIIGLILLILGGVASVIQIKLLRTGASLLLTLTFAVVGFMMAKGPKRFRKITEEQQVRFGRWSGAIVLIASIWIAISFNNTETTLFEKMNTVFFFIAPPFAVVFTMGILWKRANAVAAVTTIVLGFIFTAALTWGELLGRFNTFNHRALVAWLFCMTVMMVTSLLTAPPPKEKTEGIIWNKSYLSLPPDEQARHRGWQDWRLWWMIFVGIVLCIYGFFIYWRIRHPW